MNFTINKNGGEVLERFTAGTFDEFKAAIENVWKVGSEEGMRSFFHDRHQVKSLADTNILICRAAAEAPPTTQEDEDMTRSEMVADMARLTEEMKKQRAMGNEDAARLVQSEAETVAERLGWNN